jgi:hypothetical protein
MGAIFRVDQALKEEKFSCESLWKGKRNGVLRGNASGY